MFKFFTLIDHNINFISDISITDIHLYNRL